MVASTTTNAAEKKVPVTFSGGHDTDRQDGGRPVVLVAAGLGVKPEVFREAFKGVTPARGGKPSPGQVQNNKAALIKALKPHGVTNERLDEVSDYYRYRPEKGELWPTIAAKAHAVIVDGKIKEIVVTEPGAGYSSPPKVSVKGFAGQEFDVKLKFDKDLNQNGSISAVVLSDGKPAKK